MNEKLLGDSTTSFHHRLSTNGNNSNMKKQQEQNHQNHVKARPSSHNNHRHHEHKPLNFKDLKKNDQISSSGHPGHHSSSSNSNNNSRSSKLNSPALGGNSGVCDPKSFYKDLKHRSPTSSNSNNIKDKSSLVFPCEKLFHNNNNNSNFHHQSQSGANSRDLNSRGGPNIDNIRKYPQNNFSKPKTPPLYHPQQQQHSGNLYSSKSSGNNSKRSSRGDIEDNLHLNSHLNNNNYERSASAPIDFEKSKNFDPIDLDEKLNKLLNLGLGKKVEKKEPASSSSTASISSNSSNNSNFKSYSTGAGCSGIGVGATVIDKKDNLLFTREEEESKNLKYKDFIPLNSLFNNNSSSTSSSSSSRRRSKAEESVILDEEEEELLDLLDSPPKNNPPPPPLGQFSSSSSSSSNNKKGLSEKSVIYIGSESEEDEFEDAEEDSDDDDEIKIIQSPNNPSQSKRIKSFYNEEKGSNNFSGNKRKKASTPVIITSPAPGENDVIYIDSSDEEEDSRSSSIVEVENNKMDQDSSRKGSLHHVDDDELMDFDVTPPTPQYDFPPKNSSSEPVNVNNNIKREIPDLIHQNKETLHQHHQHQPQPPLIKKAPPQFIDLTEDDEESPKINEINGEEIKKQGNECFKRGDYTKALVLYTMCINHNSNEPAYYGNRSACNLMLKKYKDAYNDAKMAISLDSDYEKGYIRLIRSALALGDVIACEQALKDLRSKGIGSDTKQEEQKLNNLKGLKKEIEIARSKGDHRKVLYLAERSLDIADGEINLKIIKADALTKLGRFTEAQDISTAILQQNNGTLCVEAIYIRSLCLFQSDNLDKSIQAIRQALQFAPDISLYQQIYKKLKNLKDLRDTAADLFSKSKYAEAKDNYLKCIDIVKSFDQQNVTIESKLQFNLSLITHRLGELDDSLEYANSALSLNNNYSKALLHRATIYIKKERYDEAVRDYEAVQRIDPRTKDIRRLVQDAKAAAKRAKKKDYYKILGIDKNATGDEIKKAYKKRALVHHPDRHASASENVKKDQERQFKELGEAYEVLSDARKRSRYDAGHDLCEMDYPDYHCDPNQLFNMFFSSGMGGGGGNNYQRNGGFNHFRAGSGFGFSHH